MSPRRRTFCFFLILLSLNNGLDFVAGTPLGPVLADYHPSPVTPQKGFPTQRFNEVFSFGSPPLGLSINSVATPYYGTPKVNPLTTYSTYLSPTEISNTFNIVEQPITEAFGYPSDIDSLTIIENYPQTQTIQIDGIAPTANIPEIYQTPITVQTPSLSPYISVAPRYPDILPPQTIIQEILPEPCAQIVQTSVPVGIPSCDLGSSQQSPVTLQINMASPWIPDPMVTVISPTAPIPSPSPCSSFNPYSPPPPTIVIEKSKSKLKSILPILMLTLLDGGCGNNCGGGCSSGQCSATPIPFPIVIPTSSPVVPRPRSKGKSKPPSGSETKPEKTT